MAGAMLSIRRPPIHKLMKLLKPEFNVDWLNHRSVAEDRDGGLGLEVSAKIDGLVHTLFTVVADNGDESHWVEFCVGNKAVRIPYAAIKDAIDAAPSRILSSNGCLRAQTSDE